MGKLTDEDREALFDYLDGKDLYDPGKDTAQEPPDFKPQGLCRGGMCTGGHPGMCMGGQAYSKGGKIGPIKKGALHKQLGVPEGEKIPAKKLDKALNSDNETLRKRAQFAENAKHWNHYDEGGAVMEQGPEDAIIQGPLDPPRFHPADLANQPSMVQGPEDALIQGPTDDKTVAMRDAMADVPPRPQMTAPVVKPQINPADLGFYAKALQQDQPEAAAPAPAQTPVSPVKSLPPDQWEELSRVLAQGPTGRQRVSRGLASLADGIISGVARAQSPGFEKNIQEQEQGQREQLINALRAKYETGYKGQELAQNQQRLGEEARHNQAAEAEAKTVAQQNAENMALERKAQLQQLGIASENDRLERINQIDQQINAINQQKVQHPAGSWLHGGALDQQLDALQKMKGFLMGGSLAQHEQAVAWAKSHPNDPRAAKILQINGQQ